ncbi:phosphatase PAP2 family protein [Helicobacter sp. MIT 21-1697]|uniref:phosphatase PAP2 family protein n=1 Tax=Helicobacter sp. MIT 21-1697 TaxID=2993733 RepID=UPI00224AE461|nr:phosphatase PAP2 family protein [Helicobacter sp. MIT 21-1697]MCX2716938.1 phosphatase PAP2 family protein [Helicobacter sp. MIT 21-1697]
MWRHFLVKLVLLYLVIAPPPVQARENQFEQFGDAFRFLPVYVMVVSLAMEDYEGVGQLALGTLGTQLVTEGIKWGFDSAHKNGNSVAFAKRPCCEDWKGMPSGHASGAFSAVGFVYYRYGWKPAIPVGILAVLTAASRVEAKKHSILQVSVGAALAWGFSYIFTHKYMPKNTMIMPNVDTDMQGNPALSLNVRYSF